MNIVSRLGATILALVIAYPCVRPVDLADGKDGAG